MQRMLSMRDVKAQDLQGLSPETITALAAQLLEHIQRQADELQSKGRELDLKQKLIERKDRDIAWRDAKLEKITFELTRLKRWKFGAKSEVMDAQQRQMFQDTLLEDEADLEAQLAALQAALPKTAAAPQAPRRRPRRQALPDHLRRVEHHHEPESTACATPECGQPMARIGEDVSERLDIVPAEFFGLAGRVGPEGQPFVRHKASSGRFVPALSTATSTASGRAAAASAWGWNAWCKSRPIRRSSMAALLPAGSSRTR